MKVEILTPSGKVCEAEAESVVLPGPDGLMGVLDNHAPMLAELGEGEVELKGSQSSKYAVSGGFFQVEKKSLCILAESASSIS
ncbi:MAG: ATP synthase F1 subunit epsilon [Planctomycetes bacterium]|nr:ATP synthase F1 subunit epsilon [Planctomycetota bacterium]